MQRRWDMIPQTSYYISWKYIWLGRSNTYRSMQNDQTPEFIIALVNRFKQTFEKMPFILVNIYSFDDKFLYIVVCTGSQCKEQPVGSLSIKKLSNVLISPCVNCFVSVSLQSISVKLFLELFLELWMGTFTVAASQAHQWFTKE